MAAAILSQDIIAICLLLTNGNIKLQLDEVICRIEKYQETKNRHFGISRSDIRNLFQNLIFFEMELREIGEELNDIWLTDIILKVLEYHDAYFNDEGEFWIKYSLPLKINTYSSVNELWSGYNQNENDQKLKMKHVMIEFFENQDIQNISNELVRKLLKENKIKTNILVNCSRPGESS
jgi:hypothetical protein